MYLVKKYDTKMNEDINYYDMTKNEMIFNRYKTYKSYGQQVISLNEEKEMLESMKVYLKFHPLNKGRKSNDWKVPLLVYFNGSPLSQVNSITRILNKVFDKHIGSSMLRHIYLTSKYGDEMKDMITDATAMAHSHGQQGQYVLKGAGEGE
jgi:hypothetical protein